MNRFEKAMEAILEHEGFYSNHPNDPGGATKYGISFKFLKHLDISEADLNKDGLVTVEDISALTKEQAIHFYKLNFWDRYKYYLLPPELGEKVFDISVNTGPSTAHKCLQRAVRAVSGHQLKEDGIIGRKTREAVVLTPSKCILAAYKSEVAGHYRWLVAKNSKLAAFINGWLNRAYD